MFIFCICLCEVVVLALSRVGHRFQFIVVFVIVPWLAKLFLFLWLISHDDFPKTALLDFSCGRDSLGSWACSLNLQFNSYVLPPISQANWAASLTCIWIVPLSLAKAMGEVSQSFWPNAKVICFRMSSLNLSIRGTSSGEVFP